MAELIVQDAQALRRFVDAILLAPATSAKRAELEQRLLRKGEATLDEIAVYGMYFRLALQEGHVSQKEYQRLVKWLQTAVDKIVKPALSVEKMLNQRTLSSGIIRS